MWPELPAEAVLADYVFFDADSGFDGQMPWATGETPMPLIALIGTDKVQPIGKNIPRVRRVGMIIGEPMSFETYYGNADDRFAQRAVTDEIMSQIMRLSGQEYVDVYASEVKRRLEAEKDQS